MEKPWRSSLGGFALTETPFGKALETPWHARHTSVQSVVTPGRQKCVKSPPQKREKSPQKRTESPQKRTGSPEKRMKSPQKRVKSPQKGVQTPDIYMQRRLNS